MSVPLPTGGVIPPLVTPRTSDGALDLAALEDVVEHLVAGGVSGLFVLGSSGEVAFLSDADREVILRETVRVSAGRVPVLAGVNDMSTARVIEQIRLAERAGVDALVATAPFYVLPSDREIEEHFRLLAASTPLPIYAYDVPVRVHRKLSPELLVRLGLDGVIAGVKDSSGDDVSFRRLVAQNRAAGKPLVLFTGHEVVVDGALLAGADGVVPGLGNVDPRRYVDLVAAARADDWATARRLQEELNELFEIVFQAQGVGGEAAGLGAFKTALVELGIIGSNRMSAPVPSLSGDAADRIREIVARSAVPVAAR
ncbi:dihydrodipicolinate synthase family protein [Frondihabitans sucicola]|uniref:Dihydrodipicolinate synthase family protein n=1 Tax=Frondihabitans sucicola TaxID=1268041 RepID=A0ABN6XWH3_9MICO|nr:dihydrodipicolinate synthase family protein [Frondihabitans sucicola]BDZ49377.1 dihydrodipicolinate synthase family protein [Frondihabitans sucicola]